MSESRLRGKIRRIRDALEADPVDVQTLKQLAISGDGLITVDLRSKVWTKLLNVNAIEASRNHEKKEGKVYLMIHCKQIYLQLSNLCDCFGSKNCRKSQPVFGSHVLSCSVF